MNSIHIAAMIITVEMVSNRGILVLNLNVTIAAIDSVLIGNGIESPLVRVIWIKHMILAEGLCSIGRGLLYISRAKRWSMSEGSALCRRGMGMMGPMVRSQRSFRIAKSILVKPFIAMMMMMTMMMHWRKGGCSPWRWRRSRRRRGRLLPRNHMRWVGRRACKKVWDNSL